MYKVVVNIVMIARVINGPFPKDIFSLTLHVLLINDLIKMKFMFDRAK